MSSHRIVVDLSKAQYCSFRYINQYHQARATLPKKGRWTLYGTEYSDDDKLVFTGLNMKAEATRLRSIDRWTPEVKVQFSSNHAVTYLGDKAKSIWKEWNRRQFKKGK